LPKKFRGRFTKDDGDNRKEDFVYGKQKLNYDIDGIELLAKHEGYENVESLTMTRVLTDDDFKMIKRLKMKEALKHVVKDKQTIKKEEEGEDNGDEEVDIDLDDEEGEDEMEEGELEIDEDDIDGEDELQDDSDIEDDDDEEGEDDEEEGEED
jgi:hypothetical protein